MADYLKRKRGFILVSHDRYLLDECVDHIHRNSFLYRINKIEEITGVDLREYHTFIHLAINIYIEEI